ncbi:protein phosphatase 2C, partial [Helicosporidium sp. ATCC 50920]
EGGDDDGEGSSSPNDYSTPDEDAYSPPTAGCTAVCALIVDSRLVVANAGDSRCLLSRGGRAVALTTDHKPNDPAEYLRIIKAGGFVADGRVNGSLNLSRALGDMEYKQNRDLPPQEQSVTAFPEVRCETLCAEDEFLILACDGVWDVLTNQEAVDFVRERLLRGVAPKVVAEEVCARCLAPDTSGCGKGCDNMSIIVAVLKDSDFARRLAA